MWLKSLLPILLAALLAACGSDQQTEPGTSMARPDSALRAAVVREIESLNAMRSRLAQTIGDETVDQETFARVCKPVGKRAQEIASEHGWTIRQIAKKYRNPAHALDAEAAEVYQRFAQDDDLAHQWTRAERGGVTGWQYYRRITVEPSCLACHGAKAERPTFVKQNYPEDKAYGFEAGDLRGLYAVFVPDSLRPSHSTID